MTTTNDRRPAGTGRRSTERHINNSNDKRFPVTAQQVPVTNRQVAWFTVYEFVAPLIGDATDLPWPGTLAWLDLSDADKTRAVIRAGVVWALNEDAKQHAMTDAAKAIAADEDWGAVARRMIQRSGAYIPRRRSA